MLFKHTLWKNQLGISVFNTWNGYQRDHPLFVTYVFIIESLVVFSLTTQNASTLCSQLYSFFWNWLWWHLLHLIITGRGWVFITSIFMLCENMWSSLFEYSIIFVGSAIWPNWRTWCSTWLCWSQSRSLQVGWYFGGYHSGMLQPILS